MMKNIFKELGAFVLYLITACEITFGLFCTLVYLVQMNLFGATLGLMIAFPGTFYYVIRNNKNRKEETKDEELT